MFELNGIVAGYGETTVLREVSLAIPPGRVVALLGPNGAGKTTLLRVASGLLKATRGDVRLDGVSIENEPPEKRARLGICHVPQGRGIFPTMTVRENLLIHSGNADHGAGIDRAVEAFPRLGDRLSQTAGTMSGGEQQMLALTRAYLTNPRFVFVDEVSLGLAPRIVDEIFVFLRRLADEQAALLLVEQYIVRALEIADFVFILSQGEVVFAGEPTELDETEVFNRYVGAELV
jgi:branched-chain amino acid transport system ATP-binding protein